MARRLSETMPCGTLVRENVPRAAAEIRASEERLEHALDAADIGVWDWYPQTHQLLASCTAQALLGYMPGQFVEDIDSYWSRLHADDRERVEGSARAILQGDVEQDDVEHRVVLPGGQVRWLLLKGRLTRDAQGNPLRMSGTIQDVTSYKRDEWARRLLAEAGAGMASLDTSACLRGVTRAVAQRFADWAFAHARDDGQTPVVECASSRRVPQRLRDLVRAAWSEAVMTSSAVPWDRPAHFPSDDDEALRRLGQSVAHRALLDRIEPCSFVVVPLHARGQVVGSLTVARTRERSALFDEHDLATFTELARRVSARIENAMLFRAEQEMRARLGESEANYRRIVETATEGIVTLSVDRKISFANGGMARMLGTTVESLVGRSMSDFLPPASPGAEKGDDEMSPGELRLRTATGRSVWVRRTAEPLRGQDGRIEGFLCILTDITESKNAEQYRARYDLLARHAHDVFMFIRPFDGRILEVNDAAVRAYGYSHQEMRELTIADIRAPETRGAVGEDLRAGEGPGKLISTVHLRRDGTRFPVEVSVRGAVIEGEPIILSVVRDVTARRRAEEERAQNERFRELFIGMLGHDLRTPLSAILTGTTLLHRRGGLLDADARTVRRIYASGERMRRMIDQLLDFTRSRLGGGIPIAPGQVDIVDVVGPVAEELAAAHPETLVTLDADAETGGSWDADRLAQVFSNLISNAIQHGGGAPVHVEVRGEGDEVKVSVHNRGAGIDQDLLPVIFDPFRRAERRGEGKKSGLGLGLYISQQIVVGHGGTIQVRSGVEEGTTFEVTLPRIARKG
jgi:PAS domain S-box-containing protein